MSASQLAEPAGVAGHARRCEFNLALPWPMARKVVDVTTSLAVTGIGERTRTPGGEAVTCCHCVPVPAGADSETSNLSPTATQIVVPFWALPITAAWVGPVPWGTVHGNMMGRVPTAEAAAAPESGTTPVRATPMSPAPTSASPKVLVIRAPLATSTLLTALYPPLALTTPGWPAPLVVEDRKVEKAEALGVGQEVDSHYLPAPHGKGTDGIWFPVQGCEPAGHAVHKHFRARSPTREYALTWLATATAPRMLM